MKNNKSTITSVFAILSLVAVSSPVFAEGNSPSTEASVKEASAQPAKINARIERQNKRIDRQLKKGKITEEQANAEKGKVNQISEEKNEMLKENNGKPLNVAQRKTLQKKLNETNKEIKAEAQKK